MEALSIDGGRTMSPSDLAYELRMPLSNVNYHVTELHRSGLIELAGERRVRGATEHFYRQIEGNSVPRSNGHAPRVRRTRAAKARELARAA